MRYDLFIMLGYIILRRRQTFKQQRIWIHKQLGIFLFGICLICVILLFLFNLCVCVCVEFLEGCIIYALYWQVKEEDDIDVDRKLQLRLKRRRQRNRSKQVLFWAESFEIPNHCFVWTVHYKAYTDFLSFLPSSKRLYSIYFPKV